jgi:hypothetical protein
MTRRAANRTAVSVNLLSRRSLLGDGECGVNGKTAKQSRLCRKATISPPERATGRDLTTRQKQIVTGKV